MFPATATHLVEIEDQIQFTHIAEEGIENLDKEVYRLQISQLVVVGVDTYAEEQSGVASVDYLQRAEFDEIGLVLLIARGDKPMNFAFQLDFLFILEEF